MKALNLGVIMNQGSDFNQIIRIAGKTGPIDVTGYSFKGQMRQNTDPESSIVAEFLFSILDQATNKGQVRWYLPAATISAIVTSIANPLQKVRLATPFVFDIKMKDTVGTITRIAQGNVFVSPQATQETI